MPNNQLWAAGTNGFVVTPYAALTTELNSLANGNTALSSVNGTSGVFSQSNTGSAPWAQVSFYPGGSFTPSAGGHLQVWWITKDDDANFRKVASNADQAASPDLNIPLLNAAYSAGELAGVFARLPGVLHKVLLRNVSGVSLPASGNKLMIGPVALAI